MSSDAAGFQSFWWTSAEEESHLVTIWPVPGNAWPWEGEIMSVGLVVSFFNQINHDLTENNFCLLMASPAFEVA